MKKLIVVKEVGEPPKGGNGLPPPEIADRVKKLIQPITQEFGNGDLNTLRDKINEIIRQ